MTRSTHFKVCIVTISLGKGGAERSTALLSRMLVAQGCDVHLVTLTNVIDYEYAGTLLNLGLLKEKNNSVFGRFLRFKKLKRYLKAEKFDFIIDNRNRQFAKTELFYLKYVYKGFKIIYVVRSFKLDAYFPKKKKVAKKMIKMAHKIVGVSKAIAEEINTHYKTTKAQHIYNPVASLPAVSTTETNAKAYIVFLGRLEENVKNFSLLLEGYKFSQLAENRVGLKIYGNGPDKLFIEKKIKELQLEKDVELIPFTPNVTSALVNAKFLVLTSYYEGFPRVLIEALSAGTPVVSVDCKSGPTEIVKHEHNGLLVENHNAMQLAAAMNKMILDKALYSTLKENAKSSVSHLKMDEIAKKWLKLLQDA